MGDVAQGDRCVKTGGGAWFDRPGQARAEALRQVRIVAGLCRKLAVSARDAAANSTVPDYAALAMATFSERVDLAEALDALASLAESAPPPMSLDRAKELTAACVAHCSWHMFAREGEEQPPLPDCSLEEMLVANRMVVELPPERTENPDGSTTTNIRLRCDPRIIAAHYALKQYGGSPANLLQAVGYKFKVREDKSTKRRRAAEQKAPRGAVTELILWRWRSLPGSPATPHEVADSLTVEGLRDADTPERFRAALTSFRHLRNDARIAACRRALAENGVST